MPPASPRRSRRRRRRSPAADAGRAHRRPRSSAASGWPSASPSARCWPLDWAARRLRPRPERRWSSGAALLAVPVTRLMRPRGRRPGLVARVPDRRGRRGARGGRRRGAAARCRCCSPGCSCSAAAARPTYQARYAAVDLAEPARRGRQLSSVVWATTIGAVAGPNLAPLADALGAPAAARPTLRRPVRCSAPLAFAARRRWSCSLLLRPDPLLTARRLAASQPRRVAAPAAGRHRGRRRRPAAGRGGHPGRPAREVARVAGRPARRRRGGGRATW